MAASTQVQGSRAVRGVNRRRLLLSDPVFAKDLRLRLRLRSSLLLVTLCMAVPALIVAVFLAQHSNLGADHSTRAGAQLFQLLAIVQLCLVLLLTPATMAFAVSGERHQRTWDLLLVTRLSAFAIVRGKLLAGLAFNLLLVIAPLPLYGAVFLFGGVTPADVARLYAVLLATVLLLTALTLVISVLSRRPTVSLMVSGVLSLLLGFALSLGIFFQEASPPITILADVSRLGALPGTPPPLTPLAQVDPLLALLSALPDGSGGMVLGTLGLIRHAYGLPLRLALWQAYGLLSLALTLGLLLLATLLVRLRRAV